ncbi:MAG: hypothetical protein ISN26_05960, partial [Betaproteobacteria bacterium AqS2]|nr:hypothetical protein [Betaproteobacteria bacterium AqS2]
MSLRFGYQFSGLGLGFEADPGYGLTGTEEMLADLGAGETLALDEYGGGLRGGAGVSYGLAVDGLRLEAGERRSWGLGYRAETDEFKFEIRFGD